MGSDINEMVAAVVRVACKGNVEVVREAPLGANVRVPDGWVWVEVFVPETVEQLAVLEMSVPVASVRSSGPLEAWIARAPTRLFNVHLAAIDVDEGTLITVRSSLLAHNLEVATVQGCLQLLMLGAHEVKAELDQLAGVSNADTVGSGRSRLTATGGGEARPATLDAMVGPEVCERTLQAGSGSARVDRVVGYL